MTEPIVPLSPRQRAHLQARVDAYSAQLGERAMAYLESRQISRVAHRLSFGEVVSPLPGDEQFAGRLAIPTLSARGTPVGISYRCMEDHDCREEGHPKYRNTPGYPSRIYNLPAVREAGDMICIAEGQIDAATLTAVGLHAIGVPGAHVWRPSSHRILQGFDRVPFFADQDDKGAGMMLFENVRRSLPNAELVHVPAGHDVNSLLVAGGRDALMALLDAGDGAEGYDGRSEYDNAKGEDIDDDEPPF